MASKTYKDWLNEKLKSNAPNAEEVNNAAEYAAEMRSQNKDRYLDIDDMRRRVAEAQNANSPDLTGAAMGAMLGAVKPDNVSENNSYAEYGAGFNFAPSEFSSEWKDKMGELAKEYMGRSYTPSSWNDQVEEYAKQVLGRKPFEYDVNADELYNQYRAQYARNGRTAMEDAMAKAAMATGGFGNSYSQQVGQQTYNDYMSRLNDTIPELYQLAYSRYQNEGDELKNRLALAQNMEDRNRSNYDAGTSEIANKLNLAENMYGNEYNEWQDAENMRFKTAQENADLAAKATSAKTTAEQKSLLKDMSANDMVDSILGYYQKWQSGDLDEKAARASAERFIELVANNGEEELAAWLLDYFDKLFPDGNAKIDTSKPQYYKGYARDYAAAKRASLNQ